MATSLSRQSNLQESVVLRCWMLERPNALKWRSWVIGELSSLMTLRWLASFAGSIVSFHTSVPISAYVIHNFVTLHCFFLDSWNTIDDSENIKIHVCRLIVLCSDVTIHRLMVSFLCQLLPVNIIWCLTNALKTNFQLTLGAYTLIRTRMYGRRVKEHS